MDAGKEPCVTFLGGGRLHLVTDGYDLAGVKLLQLEQVRYIFADSRPGTSCVHIAMCTN